MGEGDLKDLAIECFLEGDWEPTHWENMVARLPEGRARRKVVGDALRRWSDQPEIVKEIRQWEGS